jgi:hypothetical protein
MTDIKEPLMVAKDAREKAVKLLLPYINAACEAVRGGSPREAETFAESLDRAIWGEPGSIASLGISSPDQAFARGRTGYRAVLVVRSDVGERLRVAATGVRAEEAARQVLGLASESFLSLMWSDPADVDEVLKVAEKLLAESLTSKGLGAHQGSRRQPASVGRRLLSAFERAVEKK